MVETDQNTDDNINLFVSTLEANQAKLSFTVNLIRSIRQLADPMAKLFILIQGVTGLVLPEIEEDFKATTLFHGVIK